MPAKYKSKAMTPREETDESDVYNELVEGRRTKSALQKKIENINSCKSITAYTKRV